MRKKIPAKRAPFGLVSSDFKEPLAPTAKKNRGTQGVANGEVKKRRSRGKGRVKKRRPPAAGDVDDGPKKKKEMVPSGRGAASREDENGMARLRYIRKRPLALPRAQASDAAPHTASSAAATGLAPCVACKSLHKMKVALNLDVQRRLQEHRLIFGLCYRTMSDDFATLPPGGMRKDDSICTPCVMQLEQMMMKIGKL